MSSSLRIESHDTPADLYANVARVFGEQEHNGTRWTRFAVDGVELIFFAPRETKPVEFSHFASEKVPA